MDKFVINYLYIEIDMFVNLENTLVYYHKLLEFAKKRFSSDETDKMIADVYI